MEELMKMIAKAHDPYIAKKFDQYLKDEGYTYGKLIVLAKKAEFFEFIDTFIRNKKFNDKINTQKFCNELTGYCGIKKNANAKQTESKESKDDGVSDGEVADGEAAVGEYEDEKKDSIIKMRLEGKDPIVIKLFNDGPHNEGFFYGKLFIGTNDHNINVAFDTAANDVIIFEESYNDYRWSKTFEPRKLPRNKKKYKMERFDDCLEVVGPICQDFIKYNKNSPSKKIKFLFATEIHNIDTSNPVNNFGLGIGNDYFKEFAFYYDNKNNHKNSYLVLNGYDKNKLTDTYDEIKLVKMNKDYCIDTVSWNVIKPPFLSNKKVVIDSNSNKIFLPKKVYPVVIKAILTDFNIKYDEIETKNKKYKSILLETKDQAKLPIITFIIKNSKNEDIQIKLNGHQYTTISSVNNNYCWLDFQYLNTCQHIIFGTPFLIHNYTVFNNDTKLLKIKEIPNNYTIVTVFDTDKTKPKYAPPIFCRDTPTAFSISSISEWSGAATSTIDSTWSSNTTNGVSLLATWTTTWSMC